eukprot:g11464.t1
MRTIPASSGTEAEVLLPLKLCPFDVARTKKDIWGLGIWCLAAMLKVHINKGMIEAGEAADVGNACGTAAGEAADVGNACGTAASEAADVGNACGTAAMCSA